MFAAKVQAVLPLPEGLRVLRELATPFGAATLIVANSKGDLEPGLRVQSSNLPSNPIATVPKRAVKPEDAARRRKHDGAGDPRRVCDKYPGPRAWRFRHRASSDHRPTASRRFVDRFLVSATPRWDVGSVRRERREPGRSGRRDRERRRRGGRRESRGRAWSIASFRRAREYGNWQASPAGGAERGWRSSLLTQRAHCSPLRARLHATSRSRIAPFLRLRLLPISG